MLSSSRQGDIGVASAIEYFVRKGLIVSIPFAEEADYDLIVDDGVNLYKIQVKTSRFKRNKSYQVNIGNYTYIANKPSEGKTKYFSERDVDYLFVLLGNGFKYLIPKDKVESDKKICLGYKKYKEYRVDVGELGRRWA